jgi:hypothetical protein
VGDVTGNKNATHSKNLRDSYKELTTYLKLLVTACREMLCDWIAAVELAHA